MTKNDESADNSAVRLDAIGQAVADMAAGKAMSRRR